MAREKEPDAVPVFPGYRVVFLGTGCSTAIPRIPHVLRKDVNCEVCKLAHRDPLSKERRNNVSIALAFRPTADQEPVCMVVDAGKTFREATMRFFPAHGLTGIHLLFLTHGHADAIFGLDDLREFQVCEPYMWPDGDTGNFLRSYRLISPCVKIMLHQETMDLISRMFSYLVADIPWRDKGLRITQTYVPVLDWTVIPTWHKTDFAGVPVQVFPVLHGRNYTSLGFAIGHHPGDFVYISDVSEIPADTMGYLESIAPIHRFVIDALSNEPHGTHFHLDAAMQVIAHLKPRKAFLTGLVSCHFGFHDDFERKLQVLNPDVHVAFDGLSIDIL